MMWCINSWLGFWMEYLSIGSSVSYHLILPGLRLVSSFLFLLVGLAIKPITCWQEWNLTLHDVEWRVSEDRTCSRLTATRTLIRQLHPFEVHQLFFFFACGAPVSNTSSKFIPARALDEQSAILHGPFISKGCNNQRTVSSQRQASLLQLYVNSHFATPIANFRWISWVTRRCQSPV